MTAKEILGEGFQGQIDLRERRPNLYQIIAPIFHEDGDMIDLFLDLSGVNPRGCYELEAG